MPESLPSPQDTPKSTKIISLKKRHEFTFVSQKGKRLITKSFIMQCCPPSENMVTTPRFGFIVTKKNGNAVRRNKTKRRFRALIQENLLENNILPFDYVIISRPGCVDMPFEELRKAFFWAFKKYKNLFKEGY